jgi:hypothetical protein
MQALSERDRLRFPNLSPSDGMKNWYGAATCILGGLIQERLRAEGLPEEVQRWQQGLVEGFVRPEIDAAEGNYRKRSEREVSDYMAQEILRLAGIPLRVRDISREIHRQWNQLTDAFRASCGIVPERCGANGSPGELSDEVCRVVDFNSPVFENSRLFLPSKERRNYSADQLSRLHKVTLHDVQPEFWYIPLPDFMFSREA